MTAAGATAQGAPPAADFAIDDDLVRGLLAQQHPDLATLPLCRVAAGWDNEMFRLGDQLCVRLPRRALAAPLVLKEQRWLPPLAGNLPLPVPAPLRVGRPGTDYPWHWSVVPWFAGAAADLCEPGPGQDRVLADFLRGLHRIPTDTAPPNALPRNPYRGCPLADRLPSLEPRIVRLRSETRLFSDAIRNALEAALHAPIDVEPTWIHGDLHPRNLLVLDGRFTAVIDWGDMAAGDPATDLASLWMLPTDAGRRRRALEAYGPVSPATLARARGWAILFGTVLADAGRCGDPRFQTIGERTLRQVGEDS
jgi:aminoglycoside phosphotransferase (APT) family kinase protein